MHQSNCLIKAVSLTIFCVLFVLVKSAGLSGHDVPPFPGVRVNTSDGEEPSVLILQVIYNSLSKSKHRSRVVIVISISKL